MKKTIEKIRKQEDVLVEVIQWLDEKNFSNTEIREKVDHILNHSRKLHEESDMELTKISGTVHKVYGPAERKNEND